MTSASQDRERVEKLAEEFVRRYRAGERPSIDDCAVAHPEHASEIRELFPALVLMEELGPDDSSVGAARPPPTAETPAPLVRVGGYRILREIGRGGMGVVYEAEQESLGRRVALKVLPVQSAADPRVLARFRRESRAAAHLHHTNIVPVFEVGQDGDVCYFAMQLIQGQALDQVLKELQRLRSGEVGISATGAVAHSLWTGTFAAPGAETALEPSPRGTASDTESLALATAAHAVLPGQAELSGVESNFGLYCRNVARIGLQSAEALAHAHARGIVHRDIKPSNLLLDTAGVVWVSDFGLARTEDGGLTEPGEVVGTLRYMSPERFQGECDARSDVYSLGLTLYELLTLRPPFDGSDRLRLIEQITRQEPIRPRVRERRIPRDLETVVLKAMDKDPARRYPSANDLAADLGRFLADEPIRARRTGATERLWRLGRRNPVIAGLTVVVAALLAVSLVVLIVAALIGQERDRAVQAEKRAVAAEHEVKIREHLAQAVAFRRGSQVGQRFQSLGEIRKALDLGPSSEIRRKLRDEAIAALVQPDAEVADEWEGWPEGSLGVAFDAGFQRYARLDRQGGVTVCRLSASREEVIARQPAHGQPKFHGLWMSPDGRFVAYGHSCLRESVPGVVRVLRLDGPVLSALLDVSEGMHEMALAFRLDSRQLAVGHADGTVSVYDLTTRRRVQRLEIGAAPRHLAFHPKDGRLAVAAGNAVHLFDVDAGRKLPAMRHPAPVTWTHSVAWHPDGRRLAAACNDRKIHIWDTETAAEVMLPWVGHTADGIHLAFNHAGDRLVSVDWDAQTRLWDSGTGRMLLTMPGSFGFQFSPDDRLLGHGVSGNKIRLWRLANGRELRVLRRSGADSLENIHSPVVHADGRTLAAISSHWLSFFDVASGRELASARLPRAESARPVFFDPARPLTPDPSGVRGRAVGARAGGWLTGGHSGVFLWPERPDATRPEVMCIGPPQQLAADSGVGYSAGASASADGRVVAVPQGNSTLVLHRDHADGRVLRRVVLRPQYDARFSAVSPDGRWVVTGSHFWDGRSKCALIWDADTGQKVHELPLEGSTSSKFSPDGRWLLTNAWGACRLWEAGPWREVRSFDNGSAVFTPDSRLLAIGDVLSVIRLVEPSTGREVARLTGPEPKWYAPVCFTPDGTQMIASVSGQTALYIWDLRVIRQQLQTMGLDWDWPEFPLAPAAEKPVSSVTVDTGDLGDPREDVALSSLSLALQPINPEAYLRRGRAWSRLGQHPQAIADCSAFLLLASASDSRRAEVLFRRAMLSQHLKDHPAVLADLHALVQLNVGGLPWRGQLALVCNNEAWRWSTSSAREPELAKALALARKAMELAPGNVTYRNTLGVVYYRLGHWREAVTTLEQNLTENADQVAFDLYFLAMSHHRLGDRARARDCFERAVRWHESRAAGLPEQHRTELNGFRAEAEGLLRVP